MYKLH